MYLKQKNRPKGVNGWKIAKSAPPPFGITTNSYLGMYISRRLYKTKAETTAAMYVHFLSLIHGQINWASFCPVFFAAAAQGCQIIIGTIYQNYHKIYQMAITYVSIQNGRKIDQMSIKYTIARPPKIYPNCDFWSENLPSGNPCCCRQFSRWQIVADSGGAYFGIFSAQFSHIRPYTKIYDHFCRIYEYELSIF
jgi:hypothetical protein